MDIQTCEKSIAESLISKFGGLTAMARACGHKHPTTVQGWKVRGLIPYWRRKEVLSAANGGGIPLSDNERSYLTHWRRKDKCR